VQLSHPSQSPDWWKTAFSTDRLIVHGLTSPPTQQIP